MLTDVNFEALRLRMSSEELREHLKGRLERNTQGVYETDDFNILSLFYKEAIADYYPGMNEYSKLYKQTGIYDHASFMADYGVADSYDQVLALYPQLVMSNRKYILSFVTLRKEFEQPGGWRWHKWGDYIGTQEPQAEYLYDEPVIEQIIIWHVHEVR